MNLTFTPELEQFIQDQVLSGKYSSPEAVILAAVKLLKIQENIYQGRFAELQQEIMLGVAASERGEVIEGETLFLQLQQKLNQRRETSS
jgi:antitoxin ParD1/3/4